MSRIVYVNGEFVPEEDARISVFDRGFLFADGIYEVSSVLNRTLIDNDRHLARLRRSMAELDMPSPATDAEIVEIQKTLIERNDLDEGLVYMQITRGAADRDFLYPADPKPSLVMFTQAKSVAENPAADVGLSVITVPDIRWGRRDIKTVGLLPASMAKMAAKNAGADDAWMVDEDGMITEGSSNNAYIVTADNVVITRHLSQDILHGITRRAVIDQAEKSQIRVEERPFSVEEARAAREAFITSASNLVMPVVRIDGHDIGDGRPGPIARSLRRHYIEAARTEANAV
jgi:D-alanine transaminase